MTHPNFASPAAIETQIIRCLERASIDAAAVGVFQNGRLVAERYRGLADRERGLPIDPQTRFRLCSLTKQFTAELCLRCASRGWVALDEPLARHAAERGYDWVLGAPSLRQLLTGQSGICDHWATLMLCGYAPEDALSASYLNAHWPALCRQQSPPGTAFCYSNTAYHIAGEVLSAATGQPFDVLLKECLFDPLGLSGLRFATDVGSAEPKLAVGYEQGGPAVTRICWGPDAALTSTVAALEPWEQYCDETASTQAGNPLYEPVMLNDGQQSAYGLGIRRRQTKAGAALYHGGALRGFRCARAHLPSKHLSVVLLSNSMIEAEDTALELLSMLATDRRQASRAPDRSFTGSAPGQTIGDDACKPQSPAHFFHPGTGIAAQANERCVEISQLRFALDSARSGEGPAYLEPDSKRLHLKLPDAGVDWAFEPIEVRRDGAASSPAKGSIAPAGHRYRCAALSSTLTFQEDAQGAPTARFQTPESAGYSYPLKVLGPGIWHLPCSRALDHPAPGSWTLSELEPGNAASPLRVSTWLSRGWLFEPVAEGCGA